MYLPCVKHLLIVAFVFWGGALFAQTSTTSNPLNGKENNPYTKYGIGELSNGNNAVLKGMGNVSSAWADPFEVNTDNPASYSYLQRTTFEVGAMGSTRTLTGAGETYRTGTATLSYLTLGLPVGKKGGLAIGFRPISRVYYSLQDTLNSSTTPASPMGQVIRNYNGNGGLNYAYIGAARRFGDLSIGVNAGYMFGTINDNTLVIPNDTLTINRGYSAAFSNYARIGGLYWKGGAMYQVKLDSTYSLRIGGTISMSQKIKERFESYNSSVYNFGDTLVSDTVYNSGQQSGKLTMPLSYSFGVMLSNGNKWNIGIDYSGTQWSGYKSRPDTAREFGVSNSAYKVSIGGSYTPDANSVRNYLSRVTYRAGFYYGKDYVSLANTTMPMFGVTLGGSLPFKRTFDSPHSSVDLGLDVGKMGTQQNNQIQQTYVRFTLGVSLNDKWFKPRKYE